MQPFERLETEWAEFNELDPDGMVACSSGTAALHLSLESLELVGAKEVVTSDFNMIAVPRAVAMAGLVPRFLDCDETGLMDDGEVMGNATVEPYAAAIMVHVYGRRMDMDWISSTCGVCHPVIEDLAEAHGLKPHSATDAACWSFYANKVVAGQEGGAVWFRDPRHAKLARQLRSLGFTDKHDFWHVPRGHNYRMSNAHAELVLESLTNYHENVNQRRDAEGWYDACCPAEWKLPERAVPWVYDLRIPGLSPHKQDEVVAALNAAGIAARHAFKPCHQQQEFASCRFVHAPDREPLSKVLSRECLYLPLTPGTIKADDCKRAFEIIHRVLEG